MTAILLSETVMGVAGRLDPKGTSAGVSSVGSIRRVDNRGVWTCCGMDEVLEPSESGEWGNRGDQLFIENRRLPASKNVTETEKMVTNRKTVP